MSEERASGIILRTRRLTETSLIVNWLTPGWGRISTVAKGALRPKSPLRGKLDLFHEAEFSFTRSRSTDLHTLRDLALLRTNSHLRRELQTLQQASYAAALIEQTTETDTPLPELHALQIEFVHALETSQANPGVMLAFELKLLATHGLDPEHATARSNADERQLVANLVAKPFAGIAPQEIDPMNLRAAIARARNLLEHHFDRTLPLRSLAFNLSTA